MQIEEAQSLKLAMQLLRESPHGQLLLKFLDSFGHKYDDNHTSIAVAMGRQEVYRSLLGLEREPLERIILIYPDLEQENE